MKTSLRFFVLTGMVLSAFSQSTIRFEDNRTVVIVKNQKQVPMTAYAVKVKSGNSAVGRVVDTLTSAGTMESILPGEEHEVSLPGQRLPEDSEMTWGGIYADGSTAGDPELTEILLARRSKARRDIVQAKAMVRRLRVSNATREQFVEEFGKWRMLDLMDKQSSLPVKELADATEQMLVDMAARLAEKPAP